MRRGVYFALLDDDGNPLKHVMSMDFRSMCFVSNFDRSCKVYTDDQREKISSDQAERPVIYTLGDTRLGMRIVPVYYPDELALFLRENLPVQEKINSLCGHIISILNDNDDFSDDDELKDIDLYIHNNVLAWVFWLSPVELYASIAGPENFPGLKDDDLRTRLLMSLEELRFLLSRVEWMRDEIAELDDIIVVIIEKFGGKVTLHDSCSAADLGEEDNTDHKDFFEGVASVKQDAGDWVSLKQPLLLCHYWLKKSITVNDWLNAVAQKKSNQLPVDSALMTDVEPKIDKASLVESQCLVSNSARLFNVARRKGAEMDGDDLEKNRSPSHVLA